MNISELKELEEPNSTPKIKGAANSTSTVSLLCPECGLYGGKDYDVTPRLRYVCVLCGHKWKK